MEDQIGEVHHQCHHHNDNLQSGAHDQEAKPVVDNATRPFDSGKSL